MRFWKTTVLCGLVLLAFVLLYGVQGNAEETALRGRSAFLWMVARWSGVGGDLSVGWLIPFVSAWLVWRKRAELAAAPREICFAGLVVIVASLFMHWAGVRIQQTRISLLSIITLAWGIILYLYGRKTARIMLFPCLYLVFCIPMSFLDELTLPLRLLSSRLSDILLSGLGIATARQGTLLRIGGPEPVTLGVDDPCSGLRSLLAIAALTAVYACVTLGSRWKQWTLFLSSALLAIAGNVARIASVALVARFSGAGPAMKFYHDYSAYVVFAVAALLMLWVAKLLNTDLKRRFAEWIKPGKSTA